jgi:outer membrane immunogenic protein
MQKRLALTLSALALFAASAYAGPDPLPSGKEMKAVAPAPPACPSWAGFYIGGFGGYKFASTDVTLGLSGSWLTDGTGDNTPVASAGSQDLDTSGFELGGLIGYNYQWNKWVVGLEGSGGYVWLRDSHDTGIFTTNSGDTYDVRSSFKSHYLATFGPRIGYAFCRWLPYVTGGLAVGDIDFNQQITQHNVLFSEGGSASEGKAGWMVGGGLQYAITDHWSARVQYQYIDLGSVSFDHQGVGPPGSTTYTGNSELELREHNASLAIIYKF